MVYRPNFGGSQPGLGDFMAGSRHCPNHVPTSLNNVSTRSQWRLDQVPGTLESNSDPILAKSRLCPDPIPTGPSGVLAGSRPSPRKVSKRFNEVLLRFDSILTIVDLRM